MAVIPFDPTQRATSNVPAHIDSASHVLLLALLSELVAIRDGEHNPQRAEQLRAIIRALGAVLARFEPPKGAA